VPTNKQRREAARRHLERQLARRQEQQRSNRRRNLVASIAGGIVLVAAIVIFVVAVTNDDKSSSAAGASSSASAGSSPAGSAASSAASSAAAVPSPHVTAADGTVSCTFTKSGTAAKAATAPAAKVTTKGTATATLKTTQGNIVISMPRAKAPCTVASFVSLADQKYFNSTPCHRLTTTGIYVLQCGDPTGQGTGGPGYTVPDEYTGTEKYTTGVVAMANTGSANTGGSQFFIIWKDSTTLPASYTIFGTVTSGLNVVQKVAAAGANPTGDGAPKLAISITSATITG
jgi:peptidyl-prolyl cis-trans isomerase B (cyclophilin B)